MKQVSFNRLLALLLTLCLCALPALSLADTFLPEGEVTHTDFTLDFSLHADGFPESKAHLKDWEAFLSKLDIKGSMDSLAMFAPDSRAYMDAVLRVNGKDTLPFMYDAYHSYRYIGSPALGDEVLFFQMHNFFEFMLKPYNFMELPTQYIGLLMYPDAARWVGDSYYTPVAETVAAAKEAALLQVEEAARQSAAPAPTPVAQTSGDALLAQPSQAAQTEAPTATPEPTAIPVVAEDGTVTYTVSYDALYELSQKLNAILNEDGDYERAYFFFTCLLTDITNPTTGVNAADKLMEVLGTLDLELEALDPEQQGMTVVETADTLTYTLAGTDVFVKTVQGDVTTVHLALPTSEGYLLTLDYRWDDSDTGALLDAKLSITLDGEECIGVSVNGNGLPTETALGSNGKLVIDLSGSSFEGDPMPVTFAFDWVRDSVAKPYILDVKLDWIHPLTDKPAISMHFNGTLRTVKQSVFKEGVYRQDDFFNLNESLLEEYKERLLPTIGLKLVPILLEMPAGVLNDLYTFAVDTDILVSFLE